MPKVSIYLPDALYREVQERGLALSALTQQAVRRALQESDRHGWVARMRSRPPQRAGVVDAGELLAQVREDFGA